MQYFDHVFLLPQIRLQDSPTSLLTQLHTPFPSLKQATTTKKPHTHKKRELHKSGNQNKEAKDRWDKKYPKKAKWDTKSTKIPLGSFCGLPWSVVRHIHWDSVGENWLFPLPMGISCRLVRGRRRCPLPLLSAGTLSDLNLCKPLCVLPQALLCLDQTLLPWSHPSSPPAFTLFPTPLLPKPLSIEGRGLMKRIHLQLRAQSLPFSSVLVGGAN